MWTISCQLVGVTQVVVSWRSLGGVGGIFWGLSVERFCCALSHTGWLLV